MAEARTSIHTTVTLELSEIEAQVLMSVVGSVYGDPAESYCKETAAIYYALDDAGVRVNVNINYQRHADTLGFKDGRPFEVS